MKKGKKERKNIYRPRIHLNKKTVFIQFAMPTGALAPKSIFLYFKIFGLYSINNHKSLSLCYQITLMALVFINCGTTAYFFTYGSEIGSTTDFVSSLECEYSERYVNIIIQTLKIFF